MKVQICKESDVIIGVHASWARELSASIAVSDAGSIAISHIDGYLLQDNAIWLFKIGICVYPAKRWGDPSIGYDRKGWLCMRVLWITCVTKAAALERLLIHHYLHDGGVSGCQNISPGGEGISSMFSGPIAVYVVFRACMIYDGLERRHVHAMRRS